MRKLEESKNNLRYGIKILEKFEKLSDSINDVLAAVGDAQYERYSESSRQELEKATDALSDMIEEIKYK